MSENKTPVTLPRVCEILGRKKTFIYEKIAKDETFPKTLKFGRNSYWYEEDVKDWLNNQLQPAFN